MNLNPETEIVLKIKNNTNFTQPVEILSALSSPYTANNSTNFYTFDLSAETFVGITGVRINYYINPSILGIWSPVVQLTTLSIAGIVDALNSLGLTIFNYNGTTIYGSSDAYTLRDIETV
jgi:hypothetical protein